MTGWTKARLAATLALLISGASAGAHAAEVAVPTQNPNAFVATEQGVTAPRKSLQWDADGRWTLRLDMDQRVGVTPDTGWKNVSAGAYFHITPSMRIGGSVGLGDRLAEPQRILPQDTEAPRVHLETKFKF